MSRLASPALCGSTDLTSPPAQLLRALSLAKLSAIDRRLVRYIDERSQSFDFTPGKQSPVAIDADHLATYWHVNVSEVRDAMADLVRDGMLNPVRTDFEFQGNVAYTLERQHLLWSANRLTAADRRLAIMGEPMAP